MELIALAGVAEEVELDGQALADRGTRGAVGAVSQPAAVRSQGRVADPLDGEREAVGGRGPGLIWNEKLVVKAVMFWAGGREDRSGLEKSAVGDPQREPLTADPPLKVSTPAVPVAKPAEKSRVPFPVAGVFVPVVLPVETGGTVLSETTSTRSMSPTVPWLLALCVPVFRTLRVCRPAVRTGLV